MQKLLKIVLLYFALVGAALHFAIFAYGFHLYQQSGKPVNLFAHDLIVKVEKKAPALGHFMRIGLFSSGLLADPSIYLDAKLGFNLPRWNGIGANQLRRDTTPRYTIDGEPISLNQTTRFQIAPRPPLQQVTVNSTEALQKALSAANPGQEIVLAPGTYLVPAGMRLGAEASGTANTPIVLRGKAIDRVILKFQEGAGLDISGEYWAITDLVMRGICQANACPAPINVNHTASALQLRNLFASGFSLLASGNPAKGNGLIDGVTLVGGELTESRTGWRFAFNRHVLLPVLPDHFTRVCPGPDKPPECDTLRLDQALDNAQSGHLILLSTGIYRQAGTIRVDDMTILAEPGAHLTETAADGKGALVLQGENLLVEGLECSRVVVSSGNGACLRQDWGSFTLRGVHFHESQMGVLTGHKGGKVVIEDSFIHDSGRYQPGNYGHNVYTNSGELYFRRSWSLRAANQGHELKSRSRVTIIENSLLASINSEDSRIVDIPEGGELLIRDSLLGEGPFSSNWDIIGYGLEVNSAELPHQTNRILITGNTIVSDRFGTAQLLTAKNAQKIIVANNVIVGKTRDTWPGNSIFTNRESAGLPAYPGLYILPP